jgi:hypothetical protein
MFMAQLAQVMPDTGMVIFCWGISSFLTWTSQNQKGERLTKQKLMM